MMTEEMYIWLEQYAGVSYDLGEQFSEMESDNYSMIYTDSFGWLVNLNTIIENMNNMLDIVTEYAHYIPDHLPPALKFKKIIMSTTLDRLTNIVNSIKRQMGIDITEYESFDDLTIQASILPEIIDTLSKSDVEKISSTYDECENNFDNALTETFSIGKDDFRNMYFTIASIIETYSESDDE